MAPVAALPAFHFTPRPDAPSTTPTGGPLLPIARLSCVPPLPAHPFQAGPGCGVLLPANPRSRTGLRSLRKLAACPPILWSLAAARCLHWHCTQLRFLPRAFLGKKRCVESTRSSVQQAVQSLGSWPATSTQSLAGFGRCARYLLRQFPRGPDDSGLKFHISQTPAGGMRRHALALGPSVQRTTALQELCDSTVEPSSPWGQGL